MKTLLLSLTLLFAPAFALGAGITLNWNDNSNNEEWFELERRLSSTTGVWETLAVLPADATSYLDETLEAGKVYLYRVRAGNEHGNSAWSNEASASLGLPPSAPDELDTDQPEPNKPPQVTQIGFINFSTATIAANQQ